jgi:hypothetical protein
LGQAQQCGVVKPVNGIPTLLITGSPTEVYTCIYKNYLKKMHKFASTQKDYI